VPADRRFASLAAWAGVVGALALYLETRLWLAATFPTFLDEGILAWYAQLGRNPDQRLISLQEGIRPGLVWLTIGGMSLHLDPLWSIRLIAVVFGLVTLVAGIARDSGGDQTGPADRAHRCRCPADGRRRHGRQALFDVCRPLDE